MNDVDDAIVEDTTWWVCPNCEKLNTTTVDDMTCWNWDCSEQFDSDTFDWEASDEAVQIIVEGMWKT